ncbi:MAG: hypothetical protein C0412_06990 [Flavobacterium sp.]|nr:hypothetical protein [Flavobacterium sp.]
MLEKDFIKMWIEKIKGEFLKNFPDDFLEGATTSDVDLPGKVLMLGPELFGTFEITDSKGNPYLLTANFTKVKYFLYANRTTPVKMKLPVEEKDITHIVKEYEKYLDSLVTMIEKDFKKNFPESKSFLSVSNHIFGTLNLLRY